MGRYMTQSLGTASEKTRAMDTLIRGLAGCICALVWLLLLVGTGFNPVVAGAGLLAVLALSDTVHSHNGRHSGPLRPS